MTGKYMNKEQFIPVNEPFLEGHEKKYLNECIDTGWISSDGPFVKKFEEAFSNIVERQYGIAVTNGTAALDIAVEALGLGYGDEIIVPTFTIISCLHQIVRSGAKPVLVDSDLITWNMDVSQIENKITEKTKAIMIVHIYGLPVDMDPVLKLAKNYNLKVIEDSAQMIGQTYKSKPCGSFGDISTFSFYPNKHITTGEGGMLVTNNKKLAEKCKSLRNLCFKKEQRFVHDNMGWNYRMTNFQAALGLAQLEKLDEVIVKKRSMGKLYTQLLSCIPGVQLPKKNTNYAENIYWVYGLLLNKKHALKAIDVLSFLNSNGVGARPFFYPMHQQPVFRKMHIFDQATYPVSEHLSQNGFYIPSGATLTEKNIYKVVKVIKEIIK
jgi:perosamine synthetase